MARDYGFAPNPFFGYCTVATCKPKIRETAAVGDWILGTGSKRNDRDGHVVFAMHVTEALSFEQYWWDPRFQKKKPNLCGSKKQAFGDNIYRRVRTPRGWAQADSHHSFPHGRQNSRNIEHDTQADRVLISEDFAYWGGAGPRFPPKLRSFRGIDICGRRGHKNSFSEDMVQEFVSWFRSTKDSGYCGTPLDWAKTP